MTLVTSMEFDGGEIAGLGEPGARRVDRVGLTQLPAACSRTLYTHPAYLAAQGIGEALLVRPAVTAGTAGAAMPAVFADRGRFVLHLGRLSRCDAPAIEGLADVLFRDTGADFVVFEDILTDPPEEAIGWPTMSFVYQANWRLGIAPGDPTISSSQRRQIRSKARRLAEATGKEVRCEFTRADDRLIDRIIAFNRAKITGAGRRHHLSEERLSALKAVCADVGYQALLYCGDDVIAGDIICVSGANAYTLVLGYDPAHERFSPGMQVHAFAVASLRDLGCTEVNFLWGDSPWKSRVGATRQQLTTIVVARNRRTFVSPELLRVCAPYAVAAAKGVVKRHILGRKG